MILTLFIIFFSLFVVFIASYIFLDAVNNGADFEQWLYVVGLLFCLISTIVMDILYFNIFDLGLKN